MRTPSIALRTGMAVILTGGLMASMAAGNANAAPPPSQASDTPNVQNARLETRALAGPLAAELKTFEAQSAQPQWIAYSVTQVAGDREVCCSGWNGNWNHDCGVCRLENSDHGVNMNSREATVNLEAPRAIAILFRAENKRIMKIRLVSAECTVDAGGLPFVWLTGVQPADSVAFLANYVRGENFNDSDDRKLGRESLTAIALHADESADRALESFVRPTEREELRKQTAFWLGEARGKAGLAALQQMAKSDPSTEVRAHITFALSVSRESAALDEMIRMAKEDESSHVRGQALFWLAQKAGKKASATITGAIENDPDTEVKKKAVFALSQMPKDEGVPKLIEVAQNNRNPAVRKQAMFWLGQSKDPRALAFFEKVLSQ
jgi:HEAT repeat protein